MIQFTVLPLDSSHETQLQIWQAGIDAIPAYADRVAAAKSEFSARNSTTNRTFRHVKDVLAQMCQGPRRCGYCEDSVADEVEHIKPKDLYPEDVFSWNNYLYACGPCNGPKNNHFSVIDSASGRLVDVTRKRNAPIMPPQAGTTALLNPRVEDPLRFLYLDLLNTFTFLPNTGLSAGDTLRAEYTIATLHLNDRDYLVDARRNAFDNYYARLEQYVVQKDRGVPQATLDQRRDALKREHHQTVWREIKRQHASYSDLQTLFIAAPEALAW